MDVGRSDVGNPWVVSHEDLGCDEQGDLTENGKGSIAWRQRYTANFLRDGERYEGEREAEDEEGEAWRVKTRS